MAFYAAENGIWEISQFIKTYPKNLLPKIYALSRSIVINTDSLYEPGEHLVAVYTYAGQPSRNDRDNPGTGISVPCPGEEVNGTLNCPGIQVNSVNVELFYT